MYAVKRKRKPGKLPVDERARRRFQVCGMLKRHKHIGKRSGNKQIKRKEIVGAMVKIRCALWVMKNDRDGPQENSNEDEET